MNNRTEGFILIELVIYIAIVSAVLVLITNFSWNILYGNIKTQTIRETQQNARFAMEKISRTIRAGQDPAAVFTLSGGILLENGVALTSDRVRITNLSFASITNGYRIALTTEYYNPQGRQEYQSTINLQNTALKRP